MRGGVPSVVGGDTVEGVWGYGVALRCVVGGEDGLLVLGHLKITIASNATPIRRTIENPAVLKDRNKSNRGEEYG